MEEKPWHDSMQGRIAMEPTLPPVTHGPHTWDDFVALPDDDRRELLDGRFVEMDVPTKLHEWIVATLVHYLREWAMARRAGIVLASGYKVKIRTDRGFMPDVQYFARGGRAVPQQGLDAGAPDLAIEVISRASVRYDRSEKLRGYAEIGVPEYWIFDPERRTLERFLLEPTGTYGEPGVLTGDATFAPPTFPGLVLDLAELWRLPDWFEA
jgi:Uma2 family endonuclease